MILSPSVSVRVRVREFENAQHTLIIFSYLHSNSSLPKRQILVEGKSVCLMLFVFFHYHSKVTSSVISYFVVARCW